MTMKEGAYEQQVKCGRVQGSAAVVLAALNPVVRQWRFLDCHC